MKYPEGGLYLLIDESGSMSDPMDVPGQGAVKKIDCVESILRSWLHNNSGVTVHCYGFSDEVEYKLTLKDGAGAVPSIPFDCAGSSFVWDSIDYLLDQISPQSSSTLVCITDGQDTGSNRTYSDIVENALSKGVSLQIVFIDEKIGSSVNDPANIIHTVRTPEAIQTKLEESMDKAKGFLVMKKGELDISAVVLSLVETSPDEIRMVQKAVRASVSYLESLTNLRYYPVPTLIVDEYTFKELRMCASFPNKLDDLQELIAFLSAVCITVHVGSFDPDLRGKDDYSGYSCLLPEARWRLRGLCEGCCGLKEYLEMIKSTGNIPKEEEPDVFISQLSSRKTFIANSKADLTEVLNILKNAASIHQGKVILSDTYFDQAHYYIDHQQPILEFWDRYLSKKDKEKIRDCLNDGLWKKDIHSITVAFEITLGLVFAMLSRLARTSNPAWPIAQEIHTYGVYLCRSAHQNPKLAQILGKSKFPSWFHLVDTGTTVVCLERIRKTFGALQKSNPKIDLGFGYEDLVTSTVVHEHTHAAIFEGIDPTRPQSYNLNQFKGDLNFDPVSETLAEWAELNFFRDNDKVYKVILIHAESGEFPQWPYKGAVILENEYRRSGDYTCFRTLVDWIGKDVGKAFKLLTDF